MIEIKTIETIHEELSYDRKLRKLYQQELKIIFKTLPKYIYICDEKSSLICEKWIDINNTSTIYFLFYKTKEYSVYCGGDNLKQTISEMFYGINTHSNIQPIWK